jgi:hypothetical protein
VASVKVEREDVANRFDGDMSQFRDVYVTTQIGDAVDYADAMWGDFIESRLTSGALPASVYKRVISDAVLRVMRNPDGYASENEGGYGYATRATVASGNLWFTDQDVSVLTGNLGGSLSVGTVAVGIPPR